ncbi:hypothetical protein ABPG74_012033 [Tetrahymena malaccensis]
MNLTLKYLIYIPEVYQNVIILELEKNRELKKYSQPVNQANRGEIHEIIGIEHASKNQNRKYLLRQNNKLESIIKNLTHRLMFVSEDEYYPIEQYYHKENKAIDYYGINKIAAQLL